jgi:hypothetical protein
VRFISLNLIPTSGAFIKASRRLVVLPRDATGLCDLPAPGRLARRSTSLLLFRQGLCLKEELALTKD